MYHRKIIVSNKDMQSANRRDNKKEKEDRQDGQERR